MAAREEWRKIVASALDWEQAHASLDHAVEGLAPELRGRRPANFPHSAWELLDHIRRTGQTSYHPIGTCRMGSDRLAVVDAKLRVHGVHGLRVCDASIMPTMVASNTHAPSIMIGEKASDMILADAS